MKSHTTTQDTELFVIGSTGVVISLDEIMKKVIMGLHENTGNLDHGFSTHGNIWRYVMKIVWSKIGPDMSYRMSRIATSQYLGNTGMLDVIVFMIVEKLYEDYGVDVEWTIHDGDHFLSRIKMKLVDIHRLSCIVASTPAKS